ncbi:hypothetical protein D3C81_2304730 [compost metagenome]
MLAAQALGEDEGVLRADGDDQAGRDQQAVQVALPHDGNTRVRWELLASLRSAEL